MNISNPFLTAEITHSDDPIAIAAWANSCGLAPHTGIALAASFLAGVAGPLARLPAKGPVLSPGINLAGRQNDPCLRMAIEGLVGQLLKIEKALVAKSREFTREELDETMFAPQRRRTAADLTKLGDPNPMDADLTDHDPLSRLQGDAQVSNQTVRYEGLVRPRLLLANRLPASLARVLADFHYGHGLLAGAFDNLPRNLTKRRQRIDELLLCCEGAEAPPSIAGKGPRITPESVCMKGIILFPAIEYDWLVTSRRDFLSRVIPVASLAAGDDSGEVDEIRAAEFEQLFKRTINHVLALRRAHTPVAIGFHSDVATTEFIARQRAFLRELEQVPESLRIEAAAALPITLAWALLLLSGRVDRDDYVLETAFSSARALVESARTMFLGYDHRAEGDRQFKYAKKLHARLAEHGPIPRWELLRGLDQQSLHIHGSLIRALIELGIFIQREDNRLQLGPVPIHKATAQTFIDLVPHT